MEPEGLLPHSQVPATCPYPEPDQSSPCPYIPLPEDPSSPISISIIVPFMPDLPSGLGFPTKTRIACWFTMATHTLTTYNTSYFSTATLVARMCLNVTLYVHYLSF